MNTYFKLAILSAISIGLLMCGEKKEKSSRTLFDSNGDTLRVETNNNTERQWDLTLPKGDSINIYYDSGQQAIYDSSGFLRSGDWGENLLNKQPIVKHQAVAYLPKEECWELDQIWYWTKSPLMLVIFNKGSLVDTQYFHKDLQRVIPIDSLKYYQ